MYDYLNTLHLLTAVILPKIHQDTETDTDIEINTDTQINRHTDTQTKRHANIKTRTQACAHRRMNEYETKLDGWVWSNNQRVDYIHCWVSF